MALQPGEPAAERVGWDLPSQRKMEPPSDGVVVPERCVDCSATTRQEAHSGPEDEATDSLMNKERERERENVGTAMTRLLLLPGALQGDRDAGPSALSKRREVGEVQAAAENRAWAGETREQPEHVHILVRHTGHRTPSAKVGYIPQQALIQCGARSTTAHRKHNK